MKRTISHILGIVLLASALFVVIHPSFAFHRPMTCNDWVAFFLMTTCGVIGLRGEPLVRWPFRK